MIHEAQLSPASTNLEQLERIKTQSMSDDELVYLLVILSDTDTANYDEFRIARSLLSDIAHQKESDPTIIAQAVEMGEEFDILEPKQVPIWLLDEKIRLLHKMVTRGSNIVAEDYKVDVYADPEYKDYAERIATIKERLRIISIN